MVFPVERYRQFDQWIPETDADGIDLDNTMVSKAINADFENGFIKNTVAPKTYSLPANIQADITGGMDLISSKHFYDFKNDKKDLIFYVLFQGATYKFYIEDSGVATELFIDSIVGNNGFISIADGLAPLFSYAFAEGQLKINSNLKVIYDEALLPQDIPLQLTLSYVKAKSYDTNSWAEGWNLFPRWLGWTLVNNTVEIDPAPEASEEIVENFSATPYDFGGAVGATDLTLTGFLGTGTPSSPDFAGAARLSSAVATQGIISIANIKRVKQIRFKIWTQSVTAGRYKISVTHPNGYDVYLNTNFTVGFNNSTAEITADVPKYLYDDAGTVTLNLTYDLDSTSGTGFLEISDLTLVAHSALLVTVNDDKQRAGFGEVIYLEIQYNADGLKILTNAIDWRIKEYELYLLDPSTNLYVKKYSALTGSSWGTTTVWVFTLFTVYDSDTPETLNYNYGLGASIRVDNYFYLKDEAFYKGRTYAIGRNNGLSVFQEPENIQVDSHVRQTHIAGNGLAQPDSFPYDNTKSFGYFVSRATSELIGLAITSLDELTVISNEGNEVYYIQLGSGVTLRRLKSVNGGQGCAASKTIAKTLIGAPSAQFLIWADDFGLFAYAGGREAGKSLTNRTHKNWWRINIAGNLRTAVNFYNKVRNEYWLAVGPLVIIYELNYNKFRLYEYAFDILDFIGVIDDVTYILADDNTVRLIDYAHTAKLTVELETHFTTNTIMIGKYPISSPEQEVKILQEIRAGIRNGTGVQPIRIYINPDGTEFVDYIHIPMDSNVYMALSPLSTTYSKIKFRITIPPSDVEFRELAYSFSTPGQGLAQFNSFNDNPSIDDQPHILGDGTGKGLSDGEGRALTDGNN